MAKTDRVVVLGGAGFIGNHLVAQLKGNVAHIRVVSRTASGVGGLADEYIAGDVKDPQRMKEVLADGSVVFQLTIEGDDYEKASRGVAEACVSNGVRRLIYVSTINSLYLGKKGALVREDVGPDPKPHLRDVYSRGKALSENLLLEYNQQKKLEVVIIRPGIVVGHGGRLAHGGVGVQVSPTCIMTLGDGHLKAPLVLVQDVAQGMILAMDAKVSGRAFNLVGDVFLTPVEYVQLIAQQTKRNFRTRPMSPYRYWAVVTAKYWIKRLLLNQRADRETWHDISSNAGFSQVDNSQAKQLLNWQPNNRLDFFIEQAIDVHLRPFHPSDLRLESPGQSKPRNAAALF